MAKGKRDELAVALSSCASLFRDELQSIKDAETERIRCRDERVAASGQVSHLKSRLDAAREAREELPLRMSRAQLGDDTEEVERLQKMWRTLTDDIERDERALREARERSLGSYKVDVERSAITAREALTAAQNRRREVEEALDEAFEKVERAVEEVEGLSRVYSTTG